ncbi:NAD(P)/FAD-dependent oxidoreductase [Yinghuangia sp. YIM S09857]|uniref:NAD(P)/FAD-dependent oxidoreductase n=1 Tax=Yinghuangia sp. YIM S09857 TaxID=3436929 RepID=UPI003F53891A
MSQLVVIGGGFAGVWSAVSAARLRAEAGADEGDLTITLVSPEPDLVIRPRLYEDEPAKMRVALADILGPVDAHHLPARVQSVDVGRRTVTVRRSDGTEATQAYDKLIVACGSALVRPALRGADHLFDVDTLPAAARLHDHIRQLPQQPADEGRFTAVVIGAGFTGLEVATELVARLRAVAASPDQVRVVLVDRASVVGPELGTGPRPVIERALAELSIETVLNATVQYVTRTEVALSDGTMIPASTVVWTAGMLASELTSQIPARRDHLGRLQVDKQLRVVGVSDVYAAGDTAAVEIEPGFYAMQSCQHAHAMGKHAGHNAAAVMLGLPRAATDFAPVPYVTCLDLGGAGAVFTSGWERTVAMTGQEAKELKTQINRKLIYPPAGDRKALFAGVDHLTDDRRASLVMGTA